MAVCTNLRIVKVLFNHNKAKAVQALKAKNHDDKTPVDVARSRRRSNPALLKYLQEQRSSQKARKKRKPKLKITLQPPATRDSSIQTDRPSEKQMRTVGSQTNITKIEEIKRAHIAQMLLNMGKNRK